MNNRMNSHLWITAFAISFVMVVSVKYGTAQNEDVINIKEYTPTISDAFKELKYPKILDTGITKLTLEYKLSPVLFNTTYTVDPINPAKMIGEPLNKLYRSYAKLGFGTKVTTMAEYYYSNLRSTNQSIGFYFRHLASSGKIKDYGFPGFSTNDVGLYAKKFYKEHTLVADVDYNRNVIHYYGFIPNEFPLLTDQTVKDSIKQRLMTIGAQVKFFSTYTDSSRINHALSLKYRNASDLFDAMEDYIAFRSSANKNVKVLGKSFDNQNFSLKADVDFYSDHNRIDTSNNAVISLVPQFSASYNILKFNVGFNTSFSVGDSSDQHMYVVSGLDLNLFNNVFILYASFDGFLAKNNLMDLYAENPFINTSLPMGFSNTKSKFIGGVKGSLSSYLSFNAYISKSRVEDLPLFVNDSTLNLFNKFTVIYDDASIFNTHAEITYQKAEKIKVMLISNFYQYTMSTEKRAWYKPSMDVKLACNYNLKNKIIVKAEVFALSATDGKIYNYSGSTPTEEIQRLKGTVDVNLGLEYRYSKILSGFLNFNNIGAVRYHKWYNYPTYGFTVLGGITYAF